MTKKDKISFIKSSKHGKVVAGGAKLEGYTQKELDEMIREIVKGIVSDSEIIANAYINGYK